MKMIFEGILLEKVQENVDRYLAKNGGIFSWQKMDEELIEKDRIKREEDHRKTGGDDENYKRDEDEKKRSLEIEREIIRTEWKRLFKEIWIPGAQQGNNDPKKLELMKKAIMEETHALFKKITFDAWRFKNMILACDEYVVIDSLKRYFVAEGESEGTLADEHILSKIMTIIDAIKIEAEKVYEKKKDENVKHVFLPAMNALMVVVFLSIGTKRVKIHKEKNCDVKS